MRKSNIGKAKLDRGTLESFRTSQISVFFIAAVLIVVLFIVLAVLKLGTGKGNSASLGDVFSDQTAKQATSQVNQCLHDVGEAGIWQLSNQGGYLLPDYYVFSPLGKHSILLRNDTILVPAREEIEKELSEFTSLALPACVNLSVFGREYSNGSIYVRTSLNSGSISFSVNWPIEIASGDKKIMLNDFYTDIPSQLDSARELASKIVEHDISDSDWIDESILENKGVSLSAVAQALGNGTVLYSIYDSTNRTSYMFIFAVEYSPIDYSVYGSTPIMDDIPPQIAYVGREFSYQVRAAEPGSEAFSSMRYISHTNLFDIDEATGLISFTPKPYMVGRYDIMIEAYNSYGNSAHKYMELEIRAH